MTEVSRDEELLSAMKYPLLYGDSREGERHILLVDQRVHASYSSSASSEKSMLQTVDKRETKYGIFFFLQLVMALFLAGIGFWTLAISRNGTTTEETKVPMPSKSSFPSCSGPPCFTAAKIRVATDRPGFPSFWNYAHKGPLDVSYDSRAVKINGERVFFLGGSVHPSRATKKTWNFALDEAVRNGLNMITIYVMWSAHQPVPAKKVDWSFPDAEGIECDAGESPTGSCDWNLATAIRSAADRGIFVHIRIGPYDCAEYTYGGIPEWLPLHKPTMAMRRPNREWLNAMEGFVIEMINYLSENRLWAHQGGNIVLAQIENELGGEVDPIKEHLLLVDESTGNFVDPSDTAHATGPLRNATLQDYADWSGALVERLAPNVTWTMCNGLSANNTIVTCNAVDSGEGFLKNHGDNGRIQVDQPPIFTEFEAGFQTWGETSDHPDDYFWGQTARSMARSALRWFARGGTHLNYYMWWGGYNRGRTAAAGIANWYASDTVLCPSGQRHQPKFGHFEALHEAMTAIAPTLLNAQTALGKGQPIPFLNQNGVWETGNDQRIFEYEVGKKGFKHVVFVENDASENVAVLVPRPEGLSVFLTMYPHSSILVVDGMIEFDSASIDPRAMAFQRKFAEQESVPILLDWSSWQEPIGAGAGDPMTWTQLSPMEQTELNVESRVYSDYAWYETSFFVDESMNTSRIYIETEEANAFVVLVDYEYHGANDTHHHKEGPVTLSIDTGKLSTGEHKLSLLSESLGYHNLIGRWGGGTVAKPKGITGEILLSPGGRAANISLVDGREWRSYPGLHGEALGRNGKIGRARLESNLDSGVSSSPTWSSALFDTPRYDPTSQGLFLRITSGRGHLWLNGRDLGRYWNITRGETEKYSQEYYLLPDDYFHTDGNLNEIVLFNVFGESRSSAEMVLSWIAPTDVPNFPDEVDYPDACI